MFLFTELIRLTFQGMVFYFPLTLLLLAIWFWALIYSYKRPENKDCHFLRGCFSTFITPFGLIVIAALFPNTGSSDLAGAIVLTSFVFHVAITIYFVNLWPNALGSIIASAALSGYVLLGAAFVSVQAIHGDWL
jgi:hypothetical protein